MNSAWPGGHVTAQLHVSITPGAITEAQEKDIHLFVTIIHILPDCKEVFCTGTAGDPGSLTNVWL